MLNHLEESFCIYGVYIYFSLQSSDFSTPGHGLASDTIRPEFHEALVERVEIALVLNVDTFLHDAQLLTIIELLL
jgi:hypothetical protein